MADEQQPHRAGFVALCGRPNVGKSTLLNALLGEELAIATKFPQTTRERMLGVWSRPNAQVVLVDTPGLHKAKSALNKFMVAQAISSARDVDLVLLLAEVPKLRTEEAALKWEPGPGAREALRAVMEVGHPVILVLTKADLARASDFLLPVIEAWTKLADFAAVVPISAINGRGLDHLEEEVLKRIPEHPAYFDEESLSDRTLRWHVQELVRAELFDRLGDELPYSAAVLVTKYEEGPQKDRVHAMIHVERASQKGMVIGKGGQMIKSISMGARARIQKLVDKKCELYLKVTVTKNWTKDPSALERMGYEHVAGAGEG